MLRYLPLFGFLIDILGKHFKTLVDGFDSFDIVGFCADVVGLLYSEGFSLKVTGFSDVVKNGASGSLKSCLPLVKFDNVISVAGVSVFEFVICELFWNFIYDKPWKFVIDRCSKYSDFL